MKTKRKMGKIVHAIIRKVESGGIVIWYCDGDGDVFFPFLFSLFFFFFFFFSFFWFGGLGAAETRETPPFILGTGLKSFIRSLTWDDGWTEGKEGQEEKRKKRKRRVQPVRAQHSVVKKTNAQTQETERIKRINQWTATHLISPSTNYCGAYCTEVKIMEYQRCDKAFKLLLCRTSI